jgi:hypothetical protein
MALAKSSVDPKRITAIQERCYSWPAIWVVFVCGPFC